MTLSAPICPSCGAACLTSLELAEHSRVAHWGIAFRTTLGEEDWTAVGARCPICPSTFEAESELAAHVTAVHRVGLSLTPLLSP